MFDRFYYKNIFVAKQNEIKTSKDKETTNKQKKKRSYISQTKG